MRELRIFLLQPIHSFNYHSTSAFSNMASDFHSQQHVGSVLLHLSPMPPVLKPLVLDSELNCMKYIP